MGPHLAHVHEDPVGTIGVPSHPAFEKCRILANSTLGGGRVPMATRGANGFRLVALLGSSLPEWRRTCRPTWEESCPPWQRGR